MYLSIYSLWTRINDLYDTALPSLLFAPMRFFPFVPEVLLEMSFVLELLTY